MFRPVYSRMNSSNVGSVKSSTYPPAIPRTCSRTRLSENVRSDTKIPPLEFDRDILSFRLWLGERYGPGGREDSRQNTTTRFPCYETPTRSDVSLAIISAPSASRGKRKTRPPLPLPFATTHRLIQSGTSRQSYRAFALLRMQPPVLFCPWNRQV